MKLIDFLHPFADQSGNKNGEQNNERRCIQPAATIPQPLISPPVVVAVTAPAPTTLELKDSSGHIIKTDPRYRNPSKFGWRRVVVFHANLTSVHKADNRSEVYHHSPSVKKLRTRNDIMSELRALKIRNLRIGDFSFAKERIGMPPDQEIALSAKAQTPLQKRQSIAPPEPIQTPEVLGRRVSKPKIPKGVSPLPPSPANKSRVSQKFNNAWFFSYVCVQLVHSCI